MSGELQLQHMPTADLAHHCEQETNHYFEHQDHDTRYCFELFRRALQERSDAAWEVICNQYQALIKGWVNKHSRFESTHESDEYFVMGVFGKIFGTITPEKFGNFLDLGSLLRYLKMCVHSMIMDYTRSVDYDKLFDLDESIDEADDDPSPEEQAVDRSSQQLFWDVTRARLRDEKERVVIHGLFTLDLKPQEIYDYFQNVFSDVDEIYSIRQNVISRLRRDKEFHKLLGMDD
jgi:hypothetical protein